MGILFALVLGSVVILRTNNNAASYLTVEEAGNVMGSAEKKKYNVEKTKVSSSRLRLKGYPPVQVQKEYLKELYKIDWKAVEADIESILTDSKDCE